MSSVDNLTVFYVISVKLTLSDEEERLAKIRERQRRERKEQLYSFPHQ